MDYTKSKENYLKELKNICVLRGFSKQTIKTYSYNVSKFLDFIDKSRLNLNNGGVR